MVRIPLRRILALFGAGASVLLALSLAAGCAAQTEPPPTETTKQTEPPEDTADRTEPPAADGNVQTTPTETTSEPPSKPAVEPAVTVTMLQGNYEPKEVRIRVGEAVEWFNNDTEVHGPLIIYKDGDVTQRMGSNGGPFHVGNRWTFVFEEPGKYLLKDRAVTLDVVMEQWVYVEP